MYQSFIDATTVWETYTHCVQRRIRDDAWPVAY